MKYCLFEIGPKQPPATQGMVEKVFERVLVEFVRALPIPDGNPHWKWRYEKAEYWWIEADDDGSPVREIGFGPTGEAVVISPLGENYGFIIDSNVSFESWPNDAGVQTEFERFWGEVKSEMLAENPFSQ